MAKPEYSYSVLKDLHWLQAHTFPVSWNRRVGATGSIDLDDQEEANALFHDLTEYEISSASRPLSAESDEEPVHGTLPVRTVQSKPVRKLLHMRRDYDDAAHDQRASRMGQPDLADDELPVVMVIDRPSLAA